MVGLEEDFKELFDNLKELFSLRKPAPTTPAQPASAKDSPQDIPKGDGTFQVPVRGPWKSYGGFDTSARRPNGSIGHQGVDIGAPGGTPVYAFGDGIVSSITDESTNGKGGNAINIKHNDDMRTYYAHLGTINVKPGDKVTKDTVIGTIGQSGNARNTMPHLHFEVHKGGPAVNPSAYFTVPPYQEPTGEEKKNSWLPGAKEIASNWNLKDHLAGKTTPATAVASISKIDLIVKACDAYAKVAKKL